MFTCFAHRVIGKIAEPKTLAPVVNSRSRIKVDAAVSDHSSLERFNYG